MKKTAVKLVAVMATAVLVLTGCAKTNPNVAATVGAEEISVAQVETIAKAVSAKSTESQPWGTLRSAVLQAMIQAKLARTAQQDAGITITDIQRKQAYASSPFLTAISTDPVTAQFASDFVDTYLVLNEPAGQKAIVKVISVVPVSVNPSFGTWDAAKAQFSENTGSLSKALS